MARRLAARIGLAPLTRTLLTKMRGLGDETIATVRGAGYRVDG